MAEFTVRSDSVNVEQIMEQIRARIREKRGVDYTEAEIRDLAAVRLETFIDPDKLRSGLLREFHRVRAEGDAPEALDSVIDESVLFETHRGWLRALRKLLRPILKLFLNTKALAALSAQSKAALARKSRDQITFEVIHNMVVEMTRLAIEVKNLSMRVESMQSRLEFNERRARALESAVVYKPSDPEPIAPAPRAPAYESRPPAEFRPRHDQRHDQRSDQRPDPRPDQRQDQRPDPRQEPRQDSQASLAAAQPSGDAAAPGVPDGSGQRRRRRRRRGRRGGGQPWQNPQNQNQPGQPPAPAGASAPQQSEHADEGSDDDPGGSDSGGSDNDPDPQ